MVKVTTLIVAASLPLLLAACTGSGANQADVGGSSSSEMSEDMTNIDTSTDTDVMMDDTGSVMTDTGATINDTTSPDYSSEDPMDNARD